VPDFAALCVTTSAWQKNCKKNYSSLFTSRNPGARPDGSDVFPRLSPGAFPETRVDGRRANARVGSVASMTFECFDDYDADEDRDRRALAIDTTAPDLRKSSR
jgi:hypothetical protein